MRSQSRRLLLVGLEHEVVGEAVDVPLHLLDQPSGLDSVERGQVLIQHDLSFPDYENALRWVFGPCSPLAQVCVLGGDQLALEVRCTDHLRVRYPDGNTVMERVNIEIGPVVFDHADYDAEHDVLYLHVGEPEPGEGEETPENHVIRYAPGTHRIIGLTILGPRRILERDRRVVVTIPGAVKTTTADDLADALAAV